MKLAAHTSRQTAEATTGNHHLPALTGVRFFAVFHIFLFHLIATYWAQRRQGNQTILSGLDELPGPLVSLFGNGWVSTSLFFLLSGFILAYLYWDEGGQLSTTRRRFWLTRAARIYPIHWIVMVIILAIRIPEHLAAELPSGTMIPSALATLALVQAWIPPYIPVWSWPTWTISALIFLYLIMPWLMTVLSRLSPRQMVFALLLMPFLSVVPTLVYAARMAAGAQWNMSVDMLVANNPLAWVPYFAAGMLMTRVFSISRFNPVPPRPSWFAWGDLAFVAVIAIALSGFIEQPWKFFIRQGLLMPLYIVMVLDLARGRGMMAKFFSLPGTGFLGETGFSIFIWQGVVLIFLVVISSIALPAIGPYQVWLAIGLIIALALASTYLIEKPLARWLRRKYIN